MQEQPPRKTAGFLRNKALALAETIDLKLTLSSHVWNTKSLTSEKHIEAWMGIGFGEYMMAYQYQEAPLANPIGWPTGNFLKIYHLVI
jgi:hypothetical protein